jgi:hypothetical protein
MKHGARRVLRPVFNRLKMDLATLRDALRLARQHGNEVAARSLQAEIMRQFRAERPASVRSITAAILSPSDRPEVTKRAFL